MTSQQILKPSPPLAPCRLGHHSIGARVCWTEGLTLLRGVVMGHRGSQRVITVMADSGRTVMMSCGGVARDGAR